MNRIALCAAGFDGKEFDEAEAKELIKAAEQLLDEAMETMQAKE
jgi:hypothetical protein